jgi:5-methyltetrahydropteroyltriglutamate--homocysteine methyltransferase
MTPTTDRILTTHAGSLPRPQSLIELWRSDPGDEALQAGLAQTVADVVSQQAEMGIDLVNDGEFGKPMMDEVDYAAFTRYRYGRLSGYRMEEVAETGFMGGRDRHDYADFYASGEASMSSSGRQMAARNVGAIAYTGQAQVARDIANLQRAMDGRSVAGAFVTAIAPHDPDQPGEHYATVEEEGDALAAALHLEYRAITDAGLILQVDDARLVAQYESRYSMDHDLKGFRAYAARHLELIDRALDGIPAEQVRYHLCWGSWKGPHSSDLPLAEIIDMILAINASQYVVEAANPRHEHEWQVWKETELPEGTVVVPGVVTHKTNVVEHPEVVAMRLAQYAGAVGRENVIAGTDCGMGGRIHPQVAWGKLRALSEGAALASKRLWP